MTFGTTPHNNRDCVERWLFDHTSFSALDSVQTGGLLILTFPMTAFASARLRPTVSLRAGLLVDGMAGLALLGWSYRFTAKLALVAVVAASVAAARFRLGSHAGAAARVLIVLFAVAPLDVTFRGRGRYWRVMPAVAGDFASMDQVVNGPKYGYVVVGSGMALFNEPRCFFVW
jgi:hypothetical protein